MVGPEVWFSENFNTSEQVVLVWTPSGNKSVVERLQEGSSGRCSDPFTMAAQEFIRRCQSNSVSFNYKQAFTLVHFDEKGCAPNELRIAVDSYQLMENFKQVFRKITSRRSASVPQIEISSLNKLVEKIRLKKQISSSSLCSDSELSPTMQQSDLDDATMMQQPVVDDATLAISNEVMSCKFSTTTKSNFKRSAASECVQLLCHNCHSSCCYSTSHSSSSYSCQGSQCSCLEGATWSGSYGGVITPSYERHQAGVNCQQDSKNPLSSLSTALAANEASNGKLRIAVEHSDDFSPSSPTAGDFDQQLCNKRQHQDSAPIELSSVYFKHGCFDSNCSCPHSSLSYMESTIPSGSY